MKKMVIEVLLQDEQPDLEKLSGYITDYIYDLDITFCGAKISVVGLTDDEAEEEFAFDVAGYVEDGGEGNEEQENEA